MYLQFSLFAFALTIIMTMVIRRYALAQGVVDDPSGKARKIHKQPIPLLGGLAIFIGVFVTTLLALSFGALSGSVIEVKHLVGLLLGGAWLVIGGVFDDKYDLKPKQQIVWPIAAVVTTILFGIGIESVSNPFGGEEKQLFLDSFDFVLFHFNDLPYKLTFPADIFTFVWLMAMIYASKFFDGLDGLVSGITIIGSLAIFFTSLLPHINQPQTAMLSMIVAGSFAGFLIFNFNPASIFLGEGGSTLAGFLLGALAIIAESKVSTTLIVMALPLLDLLWAVTRRTLIEKSSPTKADKKHIHHRLLESGLSQKQAVLLLYGWVVTLGGFAWFYQSSGTQLALTLTIIAITVFPLYVIFRLKKYA